MAIKIEIIIYYNTKYIILFIHMLSYIQSLLTTQNENPIFGKHIMMDIYYDIFKNLTYQEIFKMLCVSKFFNNVVKMDLLWKPIYNNKYNKHKLHESHYETCRKQVIITILKCNYNHYVDNEGMLHKPHRTIINNMFLYNIGIFNDITLMDLSKCKLSIIPTEIHKLSKLQKLALRGNNLDNLPLEFKYLTTLVGLDLAKNKFTNIPTQLFSLYNLQILQLNKNNITEIPPDIKYLTNLYSLTISNNIIYEIPPEIKYLTNLTHLWSNYNKLSCIPRVIKYLNKLEFLHLEFNNISIIPKEIKYLTSLCGLYLSNNNINVLPKEVNFLTNLKMIYLNNNNVVTTPIINNVIIRNHVDIKTSIMNYFK